MLHASPATTADARKHFDALDSLRGVAALCVVLAHTPRFGRFYDSHFIYNGYLMVDLFFVLSGFVISYAYGEKLRAGRDIGRFIWLRFWRLYPLHFTMLVIALILETLKYLAQKHAGIVPTIPAFSENTGMAFVANLFLLQFAYGAPSFDGPSWSIGVEFYVYLIFALVALLSAKHGRLTITALVISLASVTVFHRLGEDHSPFLFNLNILRCTFGFFLGVVTFEAYSQLNQRAWARGAAMEAAASLAIAGFAIFLAVKSPGYSDLVVAPIAALIILTIALAPRTGPTRVLITRPFLWLGTISYSIYMVHIFVIMLVTAMMKFALHIKVAYYTPVGLGLGTLLELVVVGIVLALSHFTFAFIEKPTRDWSKRYIGARPVRAS